MTERPASHKPASIIKRSAAMGIDLLIIFVFAGVLFLISTAINKIWPFHHLMESSYPLRHLISFSTLTLPTLLYFILMENAKKQATVGKTVLRLKVMGNSVLKAPFVSLALRNVLKFLPWEMAHTLLHRHPEFLLTGESAGDWFLAQLIVPQILVLIYVSMILFRGDNRSLYEILSKTRVIEIKS